MLSPEDFECDEDWIECVERMTEQDDDASEEY